MDAQDRQDGILSFGSLTKTINGCSFEAINEPGAEFLESAYKKVSKFDSDRKSLGTSTPP